MLEIGAQVPTGVEEGEEEEDVGCAELADNVISICADVYGRGLICVCIFVCMCVYLWIDCTVL